MDGPGSAGMLGRAFSMGDASFDHVSVRIIDIRNMNGERNISNKSRICEIRQCTEKKLIQAKQRIRRSDLDVCDTENFIKK